MKSNNFPTVGLRRGDPNPPKTLVSSSLGFEGQDPKPTQAKIILPALPSVVTLATIDPILQLLPGWEIIVID